MVEVNFKQDDDGLWRGFHVSGHAGHSVKGEDIVCAGISAVTQTAVLGLKSYLSVQRLSLSKKSGFLNCIIHDSKDAEVSEVQAILQSAYLGLKAMEESYAGYLTVEIRRN